MDYVIKAIGIIVLALGVVFTVRPQLLVDFIAWAKQGKRCYIGGVVRIVLGGLLLAASPYATFFWIPVIIGALVVVSGVLIFVLGLGRIHTYLDWWAAKPDNTRRIASILALAVGVLLILSA